MKVMVCAAFALFACACFGDPEVGEPLAGECTGEDSDPEVDVSFGRDIRPLLDRSRDEGPGCSCHNRADNAASGLSMGSLQALMRGGMNSGADIIVPGDPCASVLLQKISAAPPFGARMPNNGPPFFSDEEIQTVHDWIAEGAQDN